MSRCRCHSRRQEKRCCGPFHAGKPAPTPEALMRSRFAAYAKGLSEYIIATTDPDGPQWVDDRDEWIASVTRFSTGSRFTGLAVLDAPEPGKDEAYVAFRATLEQEGKDASFSERSRFSFRDGRWLYHSGERITAVRDVDFDPDNLLLWDPNNAPDSELWLSAAELDRETAVLGGHSQATDALHPASINWSIHIGLHLTVENQLAEAYQPVARNVARLQEDGLRRHAVLHAVMDVLMAMLATGAAFSEDEFEARLDALDASAFIASQMPGGGPIA